MKGLISLILSLLFDVSILFAQNRKIDSLKKVIATTPVDTVKGRSLCRLCNQLRIIGAYETGLMQGKAGLDLCEKNKDQKSIAGCLNNVGGIYEVQGNYPKALDYYQKSLKIRAQLGNQPGIATCLMNMGNIYWFQGNSLKALDSYQKSLKIYEQIENKQGISTCLMNMGNIYRSQGNYPKALDYFQMSLEIYEQIGDQVGIAYCLNNMGEIYTSEGNYLKALDYFQKSLRIDEQIGDTTGISNSFISIGNAYFHLKQPEIAKEYAGKGLKLAQKIKHLEFMKGGSQTSYRVDSALGDWKSAFEHHKLFKQYSDSLHNEDKAKEFGRIESKYQFEQEAEAVKRKEAESKRTEQLETERRNNLQYLSIFAGLIVLFIGLSFVGKLKITERVLDISLFATLLILFEFLLILFDPVLDRYTGGIPIQKLVFNSVIALGFAPLHGFLEKKLRKRFVRGE